MRDMKESISSNVADLFYWRNTQKALEDHSEGTRRALGTRALEELLGTQGT